MLERELPPHGSAASAGAGSAAALDQARLDLSTPLALDQGTTFRDEALGVLTDLAADRQDRLATPV